MITMLKQKKETKRKSVSIKQQIISFIREKALKYVSLLIPAKVSFYFYNLLGSYLFLELHRSKIKMQITSSQIKAITKYIKPDNNFLIFGLGNDSGFWSTINKKGRTYFLEDHQGWFDKIKQRFPGLEAGLVSYGTKRSQWSELLFDKNRLELDLPDEIKDTKWDVILVDAPMGYDDEKPGRMKSIYMASKICKKGGFVFIHDCEREVEDKYSETYLKNAVEEVGNLRVYKIE